MPSFQEVSPRPCVTTTTTLLDQGLAITLWVHLLSLKDLL